MSREPGCENSPFSRHAEHVANCHIGVPASFSAAATFDPIKPAPPVTSK